AHTEGTLTMFQLLIVALAFVGTNAQISCGGSISADSGTLSSPNHPANYPSNADCEWDISVPAGKVITVVFSAFEVEDRVGSTGLCEYDHVYLFDNNKQQATFFCGTEIPESYTTTGNSMRVGLITDSSENYSGFMLTFVAHVEGETPVIPTPGPSTAGPTAGPTDGPDSCGGTFTGATGSLVSPNYPSNYDNNLDCVYQINAPAGPLILEFSDFDVEASGCSYDYLEIREDSASGSQLGKFCGSANPGKVSTSGSSIYMRFKTDSSVTKKGWSLSWSRATCESFGGTCSSSCSDAGEWNYPCDNAGERCCKPDVFPSECGERKVSLISHPKIVGGSVATPNSYPWQASLQDGTFHYCGASLITAQWVVTAAHCIVDETSTTVVLGEHDRDTASGNEVRAPSAMIIPHEGYAAGAPYPNDIALIKLQQPVTFNDYIQPACLPEDPNMSVTTEDNCLITGWGSTQDTGNNKLLQELVVPIWSKEDCAARWGQSYILDTHICLGTGETGACNGDSGGPLNCKKNGKWYLAGATSWGYRGCTEPDYPDVYTRISKYVDWITEKISQNS
ncbi:unnamed protein product, partial [Owenia fusiformis]